MCFRNLSCELFELQTYVFCFFCFLFLCMCVINLYNLLINIFVIFWFLHYFIFNCIIYLNISLQTHKTTMILLESLQKVH